MDYQKQAQNFLNKTLTTFEAKFICSDKYFPDDEEPRDIYEITLCRKGKVYSFRFGQSIAHSRAKLAPTAYDVLACLTKYEPGSFEDFCANYGYSEDSRKAEKIYFDVQKEYSNVKRLFHDVMEELEEIQ